MAYEKGGRADKLGNRFEDRWFAYQMVRLCKEDILAITQEPVGDIDDGIDITIINKDQTIELHQCKGRNAGKGKWTLSDLKSRSIFYHIKKHLDENEHHVYKFISSDGCRGMQTLIERAKNTSEDPMHFYTHQIKYVNGVNDPSVEKDFHSFLKYIGLDTPDDKSITVAIDYLRRLEFIVALETEYLRQSIIERISDIFACDPDIIYNILTGYPIENDKLGHEINIHEIHQFLANKGIYKYDLSNNHDVWPKVHSLNEEFKNSFIQLDYGFISRDETDTILSQIKAGNSIVVHGKAGTGKSGCIQELTTRLNKENITYLTIKLDKKIPEKTLNHFSNDLELPASPALCLSHLSQGKRCVLILDQLDAIRWTNQHTRTALDVCKQLIEQVKRLNKQNANISVVLVCRTFDVENDNDIQSLFKTDTSSENLIWKKIEIKELSEESVQAVVGAVLSGVNWMIAIKKFNMPRLIISYKLIGNNSKKTVIGMGVAVITLMS